MVKTIVTHDGRFHGDEVIAYSILNVIYPGYKLIRTRNEKIINDGTIVIDVGKIYSPDDNRFDHHQIDFNQMFSSTHDINLSSAGMIYKYFGKQYLKIVLKTDYISDRLFNNIYFNVLLAVDAVDNGVHQYNKNPKPIYYTNNLSTIISKNNSNNVNNNEEQMRNFIKAAGWAALTLKGLVEHYSREDESFDGDYKIISESMTDRYKDWKTGEIIIIEMRCNNWRNCIKLYEKNNPYKTGERRVKFIIYSDKDQGGWKIRSILHSAKLIKSEDYLKKYMKNPDKLIFIHPNKFIAGAYDRDSILDIGKLSL